MKKRNLFIHITAVLLALAGTLAATAQDTPQGIDIRQGKSGIIIVEDTVGGTIRAMSGFNSSKTQAANYAEMINAYHKALGDSVHIYCMTIPIAVEYYCPDEAKQWTRKQEPVIEHIYSLLDKGVTGVKAHVVLGQHTDEPIYSRTDHHWFPLGAYYAAEAFARAAKVPFRNLNQYQERVIHDFVGTMPKFSGDRAIKNYPEDFVYHMPKDSSYTTTFVGHKTGRKGAVIGVTEPFEGNYFFQYKDGSGLAYSTFMGGDSNTTHVHTKVGNGRRLMVIKDSFGNAVPGYLFGSFEDIYVIDFRYFQDNIVTYAKEKGITDLVFINNIQLACSAATVRKCLAMLTK